jgi:hypothetical protein
LFKFSKFVFSHIDRHLEDGLAVVFAEAPEDAESFAPVSSKSTLPMSAMVSDGFLPLTVAAWEDLCPIYEALDPEDQ